MAKKRTGDILLANNIINQAQLDQALYIQKQTGKKLGTILVEQDILTVGELLNVLSRIYNIPYIQLNDVDIEDKVLRMIPKDFIIRNLVLPIRTEEKKLYIAISHPDNMNIIRELEFITSKDISPVIAFEWDIINKINKLYGGILGNPNEEFTWNEIFDDAKMKEYANFQILPKHDIMSIQKTEQDAKMKAKKQEVVNIVNRLIFETLNLKSNHVLFASEKYILRIYYRKNGRHKLLTSVPQDYKKAILERIKALVKADNIRNQNYIEKHEELIFNNKRFIANFKIFYAGTDNEFASIEFLPIQSRFKNIENIGLSSRILDGVKNALQMKNGVFIITGENKTERKETIYTFLQRLNNGKKSIISVEREISHFMDGVKQIPLDTEDQYEDAFQTVSQVQPDIVFFDDVKNPEILKKAFNLSAANTIVFITMDFISGLDAFFYLLNLGVSKYIIANNLRLILSQKGLRRLCTKCRYPAELPEQIKNQIQKKFRISSPKSFSKRGCSECDNSGYVGKITIYEFINILDKNLRHLILHNASEGQLRTQLDKLGFISLKNDALFKMAYGMVDFEQVNKLSDEI